MKQTTMETNDIGVRVVRMQLIDLSHTVRDHGRTITREGRSRARRETFKES